MEKLKLTITENSSISRSLGLTEKRVEEMLTAIKEAADESSAQTQVTDLAKKVVDKLNLTVNELFYLGFMFGEIIEQQHAEVHRQASEMFNELLRSAAKN